MFAHVYHDVLGRKGAKNVASIIFKTLRESNLLTQHKMGGELNIIFDNCMAQNEKIKN